MSRPTAERWARMSNNMPYFECSAMDGTNVEAAFKALAKLVKPIDNVKFEHNATVQPGSGQSSGSCCG